jgi:DNA-binding GntR family transcriptional regulator
MNLYESLKTDIVMGRFPPGSKLKIDMLKQHYGMGVNVIRESLARLASEDLIAAESQRGFRVAEISQSRLSDLTRLRILLETDGLKHSIENGGIDWEGDLVAAYHKLEYIEQKMRINEEKHYTIWNACDWDFHATLISACGSELHQLYHKRVFEQFRQYVMSNLKTYGFRGKDIINEHEMILNTALARDFELCSKAIEKHLSYYLLHQQHDPSS